MLFIDNLQKIVTILNENFTVTETDEVFIGDKSLFSGIRTIIDYVFLLCSNLGSIMVYLEFSCKVFEKYPVIFWLEKCDFLKEMIEYVSHGVTDDGNCPAQSKFHIINDWKLPTNRKYLFSFVGLVNLYHRYDPYFKILMKPLRKFLKQFYRNPIPLVSWTPALIEVFRKLKKSSELFTSFSNISPDKTTLL